MFSYSTRHFSNEDHHPSESQDDNWGVSRAMEPVTFATLAPRALQLVTRAALASRALEPVTFVTLGTTAIG